MPIMSGAINKLNNNILTLVTDRKFVSYDRTIKVSLRTSEEALINIIFITFIKRKTQ